MRYRFIALPRRNCKRAIIFNLFVEYMNDSTIRPRQHADAILFVFFFFYIYFGTYRSSALVIAQEAFLRDYEIDKCRREIRYGYRYRYAFSRDRSVDLTAQGLNESTRRESYALMHLCMRCALSPSSLKPTNDAEGENKRNEMFSRGGSVSYKLDERCLRRTTKDDGKREKEILKIERDLASTTGIIARDIMRDRFAVKLFYANVLLLLYGFSRIG